MILRKLNLFDKELSALTKHDKLIVTLNAHSFNIAQANYKFSTSLSNADVLLPDGISVVWAKHFLDRIKLKKIVFWEMCFEMCFKICARNEELKN